MKLIIFKLYLLLLIYIFVNCTNLLFADQNYNIVSTKPKDFVNLKTIVPEVQYDIRYYTNHNFIGKRVDGYKAPICYLTLKAANALKQVEKQLLPLGLTLKVYDCYRPFSGVRNFIRWAKDTNDLKMQNEFYVEISKDRLFKEHYILDHSGHSRGGTVDLTIVAINSKVIEYNPNKHTLQDCRLSKKNRFPDNSLDFGTGYDCFSEKSHPLNIADISEEAKANRLLLRTLMVNAGFNPFPSEWWHFGLQNEPYTDTYFDFPVK